MAKRAHSGRRPGDSGTREAIAIAARRQFAELGYDKTSMRQIAIEAGVDPTLVSHFHGSKQQLFISVVELPFNAAAVLPALLGGDRQGIGLRVAQFVMSVFEAEASRTRVLAIVRAAVTEPEAARLLREVLTREIFTPLAEGMGSEDATFRASLLGSQIIGLIMARYIVAVEPIASRDPDDVARAIAPNLQHYLTGELYPAAD